LRSLSRSQSTDSYRPQAAGRSRRSSFHEADVPEAIWGGSLGTSNRPKLVIDPLLIDYVSTFVPKSSGESFNPHVTTGVASREYLDKMLAEPFESFTFSPAGAAIYQLGQFGTAAKKLKEWDLKP